MPLFSPRICRRLCSSSPARTASATTRQNSAGAKTSCGRRRSWRRQFRIEPMKPSLDQLNQMDRDAFVRVCGPFFEHSPWIAERTWANRPFDSLHALHHAMMNVLEHAPVDEQVKLINAHPDLVGRLAREGKLTRESTA